MKLAQIRRRVADSMVTGGEGAARARTYRKPSIARTSLSEVIAGSNTFSPLDGKSGSGKGTAPIRH